MTDSELLKSFVNEYELEVNGVKFWTPYWREGEELAATQFALANRGPFKGKGTPQQIVQALHEHLPQQPFSDSELWRKYMREELHLGVECAGLVYHALDLLLAHKKIGRLQDFLYKSREDLIADYDRFGSRHRPKVTQEYLMSLPSQVTLATVESFWGNDPIRLAGVKILTDSAANTAFSEVSKLRPGDQIAMMGHDDIGHTLLVVGMRGRSIHYAHSGGTHGRAGNYGGVEYGEIEITKVADPIDNQHWLGANGNYILKAHYFGDNPLRRLRALDV